MHSLIRTWDNNEILSTSKFVIDADRLVKLQLQPQLEHILRLIAVHMLTYHNQELLISEMLSYDGDKESVREWDLGSDWIWG